MLVGVIPTNLNTMTGDATMKTLKEMKEYLDIQIVEIQNTDKELTEYEFNKLKKLTYARAILEDIK